RTEIGTPLWQRFAVPGPRRWDDDHACTAEVGSPAQVDVVTVEVNGGVEPRDRPEQGGAYHHARRRQSGHIAHCVVLLLVDFALLDEGVDLAKAADTDADVLQDTGVVPRHELG